MVVLFSVLFLRLQVLDMPIPLGYLIPAIGDELFWCAMTMEIARLTEKVGMVVRGLSFVP